MCLYMWAIHNKTQNSCIGHCGRQLSLTHFKTYIYILRRIYFWILLQWFTLTLSFLPILCKCKDIHSSMSKMDMDIFTTVSVFFSPVNLKQGSHECPLGLCLVPGAAENGEFVLVLWLVFFLVPPSYLLE